MPPKTKKKAPAKGRKRRTVIYMPVDRSDQFWPRWADVWKSVVVDELNAKCGGWRLQGIEVVRAEILPYQPKSKRGAK